MRVLSLSDLELEAKQRLDRAVYEYCAGGADDEVTLRANRAAFGRLGLLPRVLRGAGEPEIGVELLGCHTRSPVLIAPTAFHGLLHPDGECATARAATLADTILIVSMASTVAIEAIARAATTAQTGAIDSAAQAPKLWFQLNIQPDLAFTEHIVRRAEAAGCRALVVSVDAPVFGHRERDLRNGFVELPEGFCCENLREPGRPGELGPVRPIVFSPELSWEHVDWLRTITRLPIVLKGVVRPDDALHAVERGVDALMISNHGGRQLDTVPATIELLPAIAAALGGRVPLLLDGGIRRGTDVLKAIALGARAVAIGRPVLWALATGGGEGVCGALELLHTEIRRALTLCGCRALSELDPSFVRRVLEASP
jgi:4-hydroxymandelate oxidase